jgi:hypothetical protein
MLQGEYMKRSIDPIVALFCLAVLIGVGATLIHNYKASPAADPAYYQDQPKAVKITCVANLKQIGIALRIWEGDYGNHYPWNVSTNAGGTFEWCDRDKDGFDRNAYKHLQVMSNELNNTMILICPQNKTKKYGDNFLELRPENVTYRVRTGENIEETNPKEVVVVCPIDGNTLYCDGSVVEGKTNQSR